MTTQATGDEQNPAAEQPRPAAEEPHPAAAPEPALNPLQRLIQQRLRERGWSYREVARRGGLPHSTVHTLAATRNLARPPRPATIDALAKGLDVPVSAVRAAAAASTGLHYYDEAPGEPENPGDPERELLIASIDELTPEERRHVAALVESLRNRAEREPGGSLAPRARGGPGIRPARPRGHSYPIGSPAGTPSWSASSS
jgi:transcriptional regulator with XRE-family HTH domain